MILCKSSWANGFTFSLTASQIFAFYYEERLNFMRCLCLIFHPEDRIDTTVCILPHPLPQHTHTHTHTHKHSPFSICWVYCVHFKLVYFFPPNPTPLAIFCRGIWRYCQSALFRKSVRQGKCWDTHISRRGIGSILTPRLITSHACWLFSDFIPLAYLLNSLNSLPLSLC